MAGDTLTIALQGDVTLSDFARTIRDFTQLVNALTAEVGGGAEVDWTIDDLEAGSATATVRGVADTSDVVERIVSAYMVVGQSLERGEPIPYSNNIKRKAYAISQVVDGRISSVRFETASGDATIAGGVTDGERSASLTYSHGTVKGTVQTITSRRNLRFVLYDLIVDRAISCYLREEQIEDMRMAWGKKVLVSGRVGRDREHGRAVVVRDISDITTIKQVPPGSYKRARAILSSTRKAEDIIQSIRNGA